MTNGGTKKYSQEGHKIFGGSGRDYLFHIFFFCGDKIFILFPRTINKFYKFITVQKFIIFHIIYNL